MSQQGLNLRRSVQIVRRHRILVAAVTALGLIAAVGYVMLSPPKLTSQALVVLPSGSGANMATQVIIAGSDPVLSGALRSVDHGAGHGVGGSGAGRGTSLQTLRDDVHVSSLTANVIAVTARSASAAQAELLANSVAGSYLEYLGAATSPVGHVRARLLESADTATGPTLVKEIATTGIVGLLAGALTGYLAALAIGRNDRRLRERDAIANSIGVPVLASLPVEHPADAQAWGALLAGYEPPIVHAWRLRKALQELQVLDLASAGAGLADRSVTGRADDPASAGQAADYPAAADHSAAGDGGPVVVGVLSLASDPGALALGPHLAAHAASLGVRTVLVVGPQRDELTAAALRTACAMPLPETSERTRNLSLAAPDDGRAGGGLASGGSSDGSVVGVGVGVGSGLADGGADVPPGARFVVAVAVVDGKDPRIPPMARLRPAAGRSAATLLAVSSGAATAEDLARVATAAAGDGLDFIGILVADPDPSDQTTGRIPRLGESARRTVPTRVHAIPTESRR